jgi:hypothetical protein
VQTLNRVVPGAAAADTGDAALEEIGRNIGKAHNPVRR